MFTNLFRIGRDAEMRQTPSGESVANLALAYNYGPKKDGQQATQWVDAALFGKRAEALAQYLTKGTSIVASLSDVHIRTYKKNDGGEGFALAGKVVDLQFAGKPSGDGKPAQKPKPEPVDQGAFIDSDVPFYP